MLRLRRKDGNKEVLVTRSARISEDKMKVRLAFYKAENGRTFDKLVSFIDGSEYSHVEIIVQQYDDRIFNSVSASSRDGKVRRKTIHYNNKQWTIITLNINTTEEKILAFYERHKDIQFDYVGVLTSKLPFSPHHTKKWFHSEFVAHFLGLSKPHLYGISRLYEESMKLKYETID